MTTRAGAGVVRVRGRASPATDPVTVTVPDASVAADSYLLAVARNAAGESSMGSDRAARRSRSRSIRALDDRPLRL